MKISRRPLLALLPLVISVSGCVAWRQQPTPEPLSSRRLPDALRVTRNDQSVVLMEDAAVLGDSLVGYVGGNRARVASRYLIVGAPLPLFFFSFTRCQ
jgi:hypothetical protein